jgi:hypothetical protein
MGIGPESRTRAWRVEFAEERGLPVRRSHDVSEGSYEFEPDPRPARRSCRDRANGEAFRVLQQVMASTEHLRLVANTYHAELSCRAEVSRDRASLSVRATCETSSAGGSSCF